MALVWVLVSLGNTCIYSMSKQRLLIWSANIFNKTALKRVATSEEEAHKAHRILQILPGWHIPLNHDN